MLVIRFSLLFFLAPPLILIQHKAIFFELYNILSTQLWKKLTDRRRLEQSKKLINGLEPRYGIFA